MKLRGPYDLDVAWKLDLTLHARGCRLDRLRPVLLGKHVDHSHSRYSEQTARIAQLSALLPTATEEQRTMLTERPPAATTIRRPLSAGCLESTPHLVSRRSNVGVALPKYWRRAAQMLSSRAGEALT